MPSVHGYDAKGRGNADAREGFSAPHMREPLAVNDDDHGGASRGVATWLAIASVLLLVLAFVLTLGKAYAETPRRDPHQRAMFMKQHPCPANGNTRGRCPGYVVDHVKPLCAGGPDHPSNMQWQTVRDAKI